MDRVQIEHRQQVSDVNEDFAMRMQSASFQDRQMSTLEEQLITAKQAAVRESAVDDASVMRAAEDVAQDLTEKTDIDVKPGDAVRWSNCMIEKDLDVLYGEKSSSSWLMYAVRSVHFGHLSALWQILSPDLFADSERSAECARAVGVPVDLAEQWRAELEALPNPLAVFNWLKTVLADATNEPTAVDVGDTPSQRGNRPPVVVRGETFVRSG